MKRGLLNSTALFWVMIFVVGIVLSHAPAEANSPVGYAIIIQGNFDFGEGAGSDADIYFKTAYRVADTLERRNIMVLDFFYYTNQDYDPILYQKHYMRSAIESAWHVMSYAPAPLFIIMIDHGEPDKFFIDGDFFTGNHDYIAPSELNDWLNNLEYNLMPYFNNYGASGFLMGLYNI